MARQKNQQHLIDTWSRTLLVFPTDSPCTEHVCTYHICSSHTDSHMDENKKKRGSSWGRFDPFLIPNSILINTGLQKLLQIYRVRRTADTRFPHAPVTAPQWIASHDNCDQEVQSCPGLHLGGAPRAISCVSIRKILVIDGWTVKKKDGMERMFKMLAPPAP